jgi:tetratricopeptide (TPR) repeat protein
MKTKFTLFILFFVIAVSSFSQVSESEILSIKNDITNQDYVSAEIKLSSLYKKEKSNVTVNWLYAYTLSQLGKLNESKAMYENTLDLLPNSNELKLEYAQTLLKMGKLNEAKNTIEKLKYTNLETSNVLLTEAEILFWNGEYSKAKGVLTQIDQKYPKNSVTKDLKNRIKEAQATYISISGNYMSDNQPIEAIGEGIKAGKMLSHFLHPSIEIKNVNYSNNAQNIDVTLANELLIVPAGIGSKFVIGVDYNQVTEKKNLIGSLSISKSIMKKAKLTIGAERLAYKSTLESTLTDFLYNKAFMTFNYGDYNQSLLHLGYDYNIFNDDNNIQNLGAWYISKPLFDNNFKVQIGYGFGYSDSKKSTYTPTVTQTGSLFNTTNTVTSKYDLYYTPNNQMVNSAVVVLKYPIVTNLVISAKGNYGFYATAYNPQYTVSNGNNPELTYTENKTKFNPYDASLDINYKVNKQFSLSAQAAYFKTFFYDSVNGGIRLNYTF